MELGTIGMIILLLATVIYTSFVADRVNYLEMRKQEQTPQMNVSEVMGNIEWLAGKYSELDLRVAGYANLIENMSRNSTITQQTNYTPQIRQLQDRITEQQKSISEMANLIKTLNSSIQSIKNTTTTQPSQNKSCRQLLMEKYGLGQMFDVVACCELRTTGYADECCACYR